MPSTVSWINHNTLHKQQHYRESRIQHPKNYYFWPNFIQASASWSETRHASIHQRKLSQRHTLPPYRTSLDPIDSFWPKLIQANHTAHDVHQSNRVQTRLWDQSQVPGYLDRRRPRRCSYRQSPSTQSDHARQQRISPDVAANFDNERRRATRRAERGDLNGKSH
jgi:hypothetical protein